MDKQYFYFFDGDNKIEFKNPIKANIKSIKDDNNFEVEIPELSILLFSPYEDIDDLVLEELANKYNWIVKSDDKQLTDKALQIKEYFKSILK